MAADYAVIHDTYADERPRYEELAAFLGTKLRQELEARGLEVVVVWRAKDVLSFVKKALRNDYADPLSDIGDKAGVRVLVHYLDDVPVVEEVVRRLCQIHWAETKLDALEYNQLGYLGIHMDVQLQPAAADEAPKPEIGELHAELQIHTKAQSAWAVVSHHLLYKAPIDLPKEIMRRITRLVALVELFDGEVQRLRQTIREDPDYRELMVIEGLDDHIVRFTARRPDRALSALSIPALVRLHELDPDKVVRERIEPFIEAYAGKLEAIYEQYRDDTRANPLLFQPEALLIFERFENDRDHVRASWPTERLPMDLLDNLAVIWGADLEEIDGS